MRKNNYRAAAVAVLSLGVLNAGWIQSAQAGVVDTAVMVQTSRDASLASIQSQLARDEVRSQLQRFGVDATQIDGRLAVMSDAELAQLADRMQETPAGGDGLLAVIGLTFVVLIILELTGVINIFNRA